MFDPTIPNNALPLLPPNFDFRDIDLVEASRDTHIALIRFDAKIENLSNPDIFINTFSIREGVASSRIEHIYTTVKEVLLAQNMSVVQRHQNDQIVIKYMEALIYGQQSIKDKWYIGTETLIKINEILLWHQQWIISHPDKVIQQENSITWKREIRYTPPQWIEHIKNLVNNLIEYINTDDGIDPLLKLPVIKYQLEAIHPFGDGNGREWRILIILYLILTKKIWRPTLFLSEYIERNKNEYYELLHAIDKKGMSSMKHFILYILKWIKVQSEVMIILVEKVESLMKKFDAIMRDSKIFWFYNKEVLDYLFISPVSTIQSYKDMFGYDARTASSHLKKMVNANLLVELKKWRNKFFINNEYLNIIIGDN